MPRPVTCLAAALLLLTACSGSDAETPAPEAPPSPAAAAPEPQPSVGVQLFQYNWPSVARACEETFGPNDFGFVLLSPAQEHIQGEQWWTSYQPVSYQIESKLGSRDEFQQMVETCHEQGVEVIADAVINHMAGIDGGTGVAGTEFTHYDYPGLYGPNDFHNCGLTANDDIENYQDLEQIQTCELSNLADLATGDPAVQERIADYLNDLLSLGVDGFRIDAAKHMHHDDVAGILDLVDGEPTIISEVIRGGGEPVQPEDYLEVGSVFGFGWARDLAGIVQGRSLHLAVDLTDGSVPSEQAYTFVTNHDTERAGQTLNPADAENFQLASYLMLAVDYGTPILYSGYAFSDRDAGAPQTDGHIDDVVCTEGDEPADGEFLCIDDEQAAMAKWRAQVGDAPIENMVGERPILAFDRGDLGFVALSADGEETTREFTTNLPDGTYCDVISGECDVEVADGEVSVTIPAMGAVALHVAALA